MSAATEAPQASEARRGQVLAALEAEIEAGLVSPETFAEALRHMNPLDPQLVCRVDERVRPLAFELLLDSGEVALARRVAKQLSKIGLEDSYSRYVRRLFKGLETLVQPPFADVPEADVQVVPLPGARQVAFCFAGVKHRLAMPLPMMRQLLANRGLHAVFLKDRAVRSFPRLYRDGVQSLGSTREDTVAALLRIAEDLQASRVVCLGTSLGGYAALSYGLDLGADAVLAFSPPTHIPIERMPQRGHDQALAELGRPVEASDVEQYDLRPRYAGHPRPPRVRLHYPKHRELERFLAQHMAGLPTVELVANSGRIHMPMQMLVRNGVLAQELDWLANIDPAQPHISPVPDGE